MDTTRDLTRHMPQSHSQPQPQFIEVRETILAMSPAIGWSAVYLQAEDPYYSIMDVLAWGLVETAAGVRSSVGLVASTVEGNPNLALARSLDTYNSHNSHNNQNGQNDHTAGKFLLYVRTDLINAADRKRYQERGQEYSSQVAYSNQDGEQAQVSTLRGRQALKLKSDGTKDNTDVRVDGDLPALFDPQLVEHDEATGRMSIRFIIKNHPIQMLQFQVSHGKQRMVSIETWEEERR